MKFDSTKKRYTSEEREQYLRLWRQSGLSQSAFCQQFSLSKKSLSTWARKSNLKRLKLLPVQADSAITKNETSGQHVAMSASLPPPLTSVDLVFPSGLRCQVRVTSAKELVNIIQEYERCS
jgi:transposase-like protein